MLPAGAPVCTVHGEVCCAAGPTLTDGNILQQGLQAYKLGITDFNRIFYVQGQIQCSFTG